MCWIFASQQFYTSRFNSGYSGTLDRYSLQQYFDLHWAEDFAWLLNFNSVEMGR